MATPHRAKEHLAVSSPMRCGTTTALALWTICVCATLLIAAGQAAAQTPARRYGVITFDWDNVVASRVSELGTSLIRVPCHWDQMEPSRGNYTWECSDAGIYGANALGVQVLLSVECTPAWARSGGNCNTMPSSMSDFYNFVAAFVQRYEAYDVILGIWNEPNLQRVSWRNYCALFGAASDARNRHSANFRLAAPETSHHAVTATFYYYLVMRCIIGNGDWAAQDITTVHWYSDGPDLGAYLDFVHRYGGRHEVWLSETGIGDGDESQVAFLSWLETHFLKAGLRRPWWTKIIIYRLWDNECCSFALLYADYSPKPGFYAYQAWIADETGNSRGAMHGDDYIAPDSFITSGDFRYSLWYQNDGNLVLYDSQMQPLWASWTFASPGTTIMQPDGNLVMYDSGGTPVWWSGTCCHSGYYFVLRNDANMVIYDATGAHVAWINEPD